jgi:hypothetical protein
MSWTIARTDPATGAPACAICVVDGVRLQVYRHIAAPHRWTAYAARWLADVALEAAELDQAQAEALALLEAARSEPLKHVVVGLVRESTVGSQPSPRLVAKEEPVAQAERHGDVAPA